MKIGMIGCGNLGNSLAKQLARFHQLTVYDRFPEKITVHKEFPQIKIGKDLQETIRQAEMIILAIKPNDFEIAAEQMKQHLQPTQVLISMLAGVSVSRIKKILGVKNPIVRMMPNLAVEYGQGVIGIAESTSITSKLKERLSSIFSTMGLILWLSEDKINALTALAGSGPAFICVFIEAMIDAGIALGFTSSDAKNIVLQTLTGTLSMIQQTGKHPAELRWQVSSPAGTTIAGQVVLENSSVRAGIIKTFLAANDRAKELEG